MAKFTKMAGLFQFMFVDCWPAITWSVIDYDREPKKGYWALARAFQPVLPCIVRERERVVAGLKLLKEIWVVNDLPRPHPDCLIEVALENSAGSICEQKVYPIGVPSNQAVRVYSVSPGAGEWCVTDSLEPGDYRLRLALKTVEGDLLGENDYHVAVLDPHGAFRMEF
jgi:beta-mannosidase